MGKTFLRVLTFTAIVCLLVAATAYVMNVAPNGIKLSIGWQPVSERVCGDLNVGWPFLAEQGMSCEITQRNRLADFLNLFSAIVAYVAVPLVILIKFEKRSPKESKQ